MMYDPGNPEHLAAVRRALSEERLVSYDSWAGGDQAVGLKLYEWNTVASAACYGTLQAVEVVLRNAIHDQLTAMHGAGGLPGTWLDDPAQLLEPRRVADIAAARRRLARLGRPPTPGRVVAELPFGFWRYLLSARYEQFLWTPALRHAFPYLQPQRRRAIAEPVERLHYLRNRIAHHEPIHRRALASDYADMLTIVGVICPHTRGWAEATSYVPAAHAARPALVARVDLPRGRLARVRDLE